MSWYSEPTPTLAGRRLAARGAQATFDPGLRRTTLKKWVVGHLILMQMGLLGVGLDSQLAPVRVEDPAEIYTHVLKRVAAEPVTSAYQNTVWADLLVNERGEVESVTNLQGNPAHFTSATAALRQFQFTPFVRDGKAVRALVRINIFVRDTVPTAEEMLSKSASEAFLACDKAVRGNDAEAEALCRDAVAKFEKLPGERSRERAHLQTLLGEVLMGKRRPSEALEQFKAVLALDLASRKPTDIELGISHRFVGLAQAALQRFSDAEGSYEKAIAIVEQAIEAAAPQRQRYETYLRVVLLDCAAVKRAVGKEAEAQQLEQRAQRLQ